MSITNIKGENGDQGHLFTPILQKKKKKKEKEKKKKQRILNDDSVIP